MIAALGAMSLCALAPAYVDPSIAICVLAPVALAITWRNENAERRARRHLHVVGRQGGATR